MKIAVEALQEALRIERDQLSKRLVWHDQYSKSLRGVEDGIALSRRAIAEYEAAIVQLERKDRIERLYGSADAVREV